MAQVNIDFSSYTWPGTDWTDKPGSWTIGYQIAANLLETDSYGDACAVYKSSVTDFADDQYCEVTTGIADINGDLASYGPAILMNESTGECFVAACGGDGGGSNVCKIWHVVNSSTFNAIPGAEVSIPNTIPIGTRFKIAYDGTDITVYHDIDGQDYNTPVITYTRATGPSTGQPGLQCYAPNATRELGISAMEMGDSAGPNPNPGGELYNVCVTVSVPDRTDFAQQASGRKLQTTSGSDFYLNGATPWHLFHRLTPAERDTYLNDCVDKGINAVIVSMMVTSSTDYGVAEWNNVLGPEMFSDRDNWVLSTSFKAPDSSLGRGCKNYLDLVKDGIAACEARGITVLLCPAYIGYGGTDQGWQTVNSPGTYSFMSGQSDTQMYNFGIQIGLAFGPSMHGNILWVHGCDNDADNITGLGAKVNKIHEGIAFIESVTGGVRPATYHGNRNGTGRDDFTLTNGMGFDTAYSAVNNTDTYCKTAYDDTPTLPFVFFEGQYENYGTVTTKQVRWQAWTGMLSGSAGQFYGNEDIWNFAAHTAGGGDGDWEDALNDPGRADMEYVNQHSEAGLVPDWSHAVLTAGYGSLGNGTYSSCAVSADNKRVLAYTPDNGAMTFDFTGLTGATAKGDWINPRTGEITEAFASAELSTLGAKVLTPSTNDDWALRVVASSAAGDSSVLNRPIGIGSPNPIANKIGGQGGLG